LLLSLPLTFEILQQRLLAAARHHIRNGEFTERGLARVIDVSQPHLHNVLKGVKALTPGVGDALLAGLSLSLFDLLSPDELGQSLLDRQPHASLVRHGPILQGRIGPNDPFPDWRAVAEWFRVSSPSLYRVRRPTLAACSPDPELLHLPIPSFALLEMDEAARLRFPPHAWFLLRWRGAAYLRRLRREPGSLVILGQKSTLASALPPSIQLSEASVLHTVRARLLWVGPDPRYADPFALHAPGFPSLAADS
jgi:hypothetical protein